MLYKIAIRKFDFRLQKFINFLSFDGVRFKPEPPTQFSHWLVYALGSYRNSPFVTGSWSSTKTEILNYEAKEWSQAADYPFSDGIRFIQYKFWKILI